ncbi:MAG: L-serine ammonia-lyase, iron-sulfur-dependent, subunit alpha [Candidatus Gastranaerophilales bacterium]|nr:L-serine ammonia-lyase, iron-sulfur-dependent, subunit alpha [Candidatus Gastranaerophilales bacterium]
MSNIENFQELQERTRDNNRFYEIFLEIESAKLEKSKDQLKELMRAHLNDMKVSIKQGLSNPQLSVSGMSGTDSVKVVERYDKGKKLPMNKLFGKILSYALAVIEENQRMGKIVACPTAGSCGIVPAVVVAYAEEFNISEEMQINSLFTAGGIGKLVAQEVPLAGAVAGCQAECGVGSAMAAAAIVELMSGTNDMIINAAALALKNTLGLVCDPVAGLVEVPCVKRNAFYAIHAVSASELALAGVETVIPMDEIVVAMKQIGYLMSPDLKESSDGGLATTETGQSIAKRLEKLWFENK